jgi:hypothetical protein
MFGGMRMEGVVRTEAAGGFMRTGRKKAPQAVLRDRDGY